MVSVTIGHGTSLMAPSIIRNTMTKPERMRPVQRAGFETGAGSVIVVMACSCRVVFNGCSDSRRTRRAETDNGCAIFRGVRFFPSPLVGEGGSTARSVGETDEGFVSADESLALVFAERTPHPALRATFSHKGPVALFAFE